MKRTENGFSLVELIIALAISSLIFGAATMFLGTAQKSYQLAEETIDLQKESQIFMEQMSGWVMECNRINDSVSGSSTALTLYKIPRNHGRVFTEAAMSPYSNPAASKRVIWKNGSKLYMIVVNGIADASADDNMAIDFDALSIDENCVAEYVELFDIVYDDSKRNQLSVTLNMKEGTRTHSLTNEFMMRNEYIGR